MLRLHHVQPGRAELEPALSRALAWGLVELAMSLRIQSAMDWALTLHTGAAWLTARPWSVVSTCLRAWPRPCWFRCKPTRR